MKKNIKGTIFKSYFLCFIALLFFYISCVYYFDLEKDILGIVDLHIIFPPIWIADILLIIIIPSIISYLIYLSKEENKKCFEQLNNKERLITNGIEFTTNLINNNLEFDESQYSKNDKLLSALSMLKNRLIESQKEELIRKTEDEQRRWATEGQAKFAEILRENSNNSIEELAYKIISSLTNYLDANVGGFFMYYEENARKYFSLIACYAFEHRRIITKEINWGDGLIGRCAIEKETIYLTEIPKDYLKITSGLGGDNPRCIVIVPMISNDILQGVIEIASFKVIEKYQVEFIEKIAEIIASTLSSVKINLQTSRLLAESREQSQKLALQEEEMRQKVEEMRIIQKEAARQSEEFISFSNSVNHTMIRADFDTRGKLIYANTKFLNSLGFERNSEVEGKFIFDFIHEKDKEWFNKIWDNLSKGGKHYEGFMKHVTKEGKDLWTLSTYTCVRNDRGDVSKILFLALDTTENKIQSLNYEAIIEALNRSSLKAEIDIDGQIIDCNNNFLQTLDYTQDEIKNLTFFDLLVFNDDTKNQTSNVDLKKLWSKAIRGTSFDQLLNFKTKNSIEKWFFGSYSPVRNMYGDVVKIIFVGYDSTEQVLFEQKVEQQNQKLREQETLLQQNQILLEQKLQETRAEVEQI
ncbi:MAG: PAS domain-containing protein, partial [Bacteroidales bacterium]